MKPVIDRDFVSVDPLNVSIQTSIEGAYYQRGIDENVVRNLTANDEMISDLHRKNRDRVVWIVDNHLAEYMSPKIKIALIKTPFGKWSDKRISKVAKRGFALETLLWNLELEEKMPIFEDSKIFSMEPRHDLLGKIPFNQPLDTFILDSHLIDHEQQARFHELNWAYFLRAEIEAQGDSNRFNSTEKAMLYQAMGEKLVALGLITGVLDGDLPVAGKPFSRLSEDQKNLVGDIAAIRLKIHNWVTNRDFNEGSGSHAA